jgi:hypothetical protein
MCCRLKPEFPQLAQGGHHAEPAVCMDVLHAKGLRCGGLGL